MINEKHAIKLTCQKGNVLYQIKKLAREEIQQANDFIGQCMHYVYSYKDAQFEQIVLFYRPFCQVCAESRWLYPNLTMI